MYYLFTAIPYQDSYRRTPPRLGLKTYIVMLTCVHFITTRVKSITSKNTTALDGRRWLSMTVDAHRRRSNFSMILEVAADRWRAIFEY